MNIPDCRIREVINEAGDDFDFHDIILAFAQRNQRLYVDALAATNSDTPFQALHSTLGKRVREICEEFGYTGEPTSSPDIFGNMSGCTRWTR